MIKLTQEREITPYVWVHPDEERRKGRDLRAVRAYPSGRCLPVAVLVGK